MKPDFTETETCLIEKAKQISAYVLTPVAEATDRGSRPNSTHFRALGEAGMAGLSLPTLWGGSDISSLAQREIIEALASGCGVTCFTLMQHHGSSRMIANSKAEALKACVLPHLAKGNSYCAVSFAHLRRPGKPVLTATPVDGGYRLSGTAPWVTGWGLMNQVVIGAELPDARHIYLWIPQDREDFAELFDDVSAPKQNWGEAIASDPLPLCAMNASSTVELTLTDYFVPEIHFLHHSDRETMQRNDRNNVLGPTAAPLGCALASLRVLDGLAEKRNLPAIHESFGLLSEEYSRLKSAVLEDLQTSSDNINLEKVLALRAEVILLAQRGALSACAASSGAANSLSHPSQRLLREAMFYSVQAQTQDVMSATLSALSCSVTKTAE